MTPTLGYIAPHAKAFNKGAQVFESTDQFEKRKQDHIRIALAPEAQSSQSTGLDRVELIHEALPEIDLSDVNLSTSLLGESFSTPAFVSSMTAGHAQGEQLNLRLARACAARKWLMGVGSQRRQLMDRDASLEWKSLREKVPDVRLMGNIGLSQLPEVQVSQIQELVESIGALAMIVHTNPLQEALQPEGTPKFKGCIEVLERLCEELQVPVILKETGCGFSARSFEKIKDLNLYAVDVSGLGGTHWGRVEEGRIEDEIVEKRAARSFANWGISTLESLLQGQRVQPNFRLWASGGVRTGIDVAKLVALGAEAVGLAQPMMKAALISEQAVKDTMACIEYELKVALFCTGCKNIEDLRTQPVCKIR